MLRTLLIGSQNPKKVGELAEILHDLPWRVKSLQDFPSAPEPEEDGRTFQDNAVKKAVYYANRFQVWCAADDSGLVVDSLDGAPGVYSARFAGPQATDAENNAKLLAALVGVPESQRTARFVCCAALVEPGGTPHLEMGTVEGRIGFENRGTVGFGYDPLFTPDGHDKTFAQMTAAEKHAVSHRGRAFANLRSYIASLP